MTTKAKQGRPSMTPAYVKLIEETPKGTCVQVGMHPTNEPFQSQQAAAYHRDNIRRKLRVKSVAEVVKVADAIEEIEYIESDGRNWPTFAPGYFLVLHGRKKEST